MKIQEFRIVLPLSIEEYKIAQLWTVIQESKDATGGGEGVEWITNEPSTNEEIGKAHRTKKIYHLNSHLPSVIRMLAPKGSLELQETSFNAHPRYKTTISNSDYMKQGFHTTIRTCIQPNLGETENVYNLDPDMLSQREVINIDFVNDPVYPRDYREDADPKLFLSKMEGSEPLTSDWMEHLKSSSFQQSYICVYKLVECEFLWKGYQERMETIIMKYMKQLFHIFHRRLYCEMDNWRKLTLDDIRKLERETKDELDSMRSTGSLKITTLNHP